MSNKPKIEVLTCTETTRRHTVKVDGQMILNMLRLVEPKEYGSRVPKNIRVYFHVPGGGDWSNMAIDVDEENPVYVEWTTSEVKDERSEG